jgi:hypothetical protein
LWSGTVGSDMFAVCGVAKSKSGIVWGTVVGSKRSSDIPVRGQVKYQSANLRVVLRSFA